MRDTAHLSMLEDCAYRRLLDAYYVREKPLPLDVRDCCKLARATSKPERDAVAYVLREFFEQCDDGHHQSRADAEIERYQYKQRKASASATARWAHRGQPSDRNADADANAPPDAMRTHSEGNAPRATRADAGARPSPVPRHQTPPTDPEDPRFLLPLVGGSGLAPSGAAPPTSPPAFDGLNADALNGKAVVPIAAGFQLPEEWGNDALALGFKAAEALREAEKFRQYWVVGKGAGKRRSVKGWRQTWSNWLDKAAKDAR